MLNNYLKQAFRALRRDRLYSLLNLAGLATGLAAALLVLLWVQDELTYDRFHRQGKNIYRVLTNWDFGGDRQWTGVTPALLGPTAKAELPEVQEAVRTWRLSTLTVKINATLLEAENCLVVDKALFDVFDFQLLRSDGTAPLSTPNGVLLTESLARKCFADADPLGKTLRFDNRADLVVTGILKDPPSNSSIKFSCLLPWEPVAGQFVRNPRNFNWGNMSYTTWLLLRPGTDLRQLEHKLAEMVARHRAEAKNDAPDFWYMVQPLHEVYLDSGFLKFTLNSGDRKSLAVFGFIGLLILGIACINYVNLATARATARAREVGVRKAVGAGSAQLFGQFMAESGLLILLASGLSVALAIAVLPLFNEIAGKNLRVAQFAEPEVLRVVGASALLALLLAGIYPALLLTRFNPSRVLRGATTLARGGHSRLRQSLATAQFVFSVALIFCALVISRQIDFVRSKKLGYERAQIFQFYLPYQDPPTERVLRDLQASPDVADVCISDNNIVGIGSQNGGIDYEGRPADKEMPIWQMVASSGFQAFFGLEMAQGRWFRPEMNGADSTSFVLNEAAVREMGLQEPVIGKWIEFQDIRGNVAGVVRDFHFESLHKPVEPLIIWQYPGQYYAVYVKTRPGQEQNAIAAAETVYRRHVPDKVFKYTFLDDEYDKFYKSETRSAQLFRLFAGLAVLISCIGLFGLATFTTAQRTREIGIRKVLGAGVLHITGLLTRDFLKLVLLAIAIGAPLAWLFMRKWLENFAFRIEIQGWMFAAVGLAALGIAAGTVGFQSIRAALANPVKSLRNE